MAAAALAAAIMTACAGSDELTDTPQQPENTGKVVTLTTTVGFDDSSATTRALDIDFTNKKAVKTFAEGEKMAVVYNNGTSLVKAESHALEDGDITNGGKNATFTFDLETPDKTKDVTYIYPAAMAKDDCTIKNDALATQDGTLGSLSSNLDLATYTGAWNGDNLPTATLANELAVLAVTVKDAGGSSIITGGLNKVTISAVTTEGTNTYTVTPTGSTFGEEVIYVAMLPTDKADITVTATDGTNNYAKILPGKTYAAGNIYNLGWRMDGRLCEPLTIEAITGGTIVVDNPPSGMQYSKNGGEKAAVSSVGGTISVSAGDKVQFYGDGTSITSYRGTNITGSGEGFTCKAYGNIMSLVNENNFAEEITLVDYAFTELFCNNATLTDASGLLLPATTLAEACYAHLFDGCTSLTAAPALPATTLAESCYSGMFQECTSLETAPALPAETLAEGCYMCMFALCSKLRAVTCLATNISASNCTVLWLDEAGTAVTGTKTFTKAASMTGWPSGVSGIPSDWTVVDYVAP